jgi:hypothetical protein
MSTGTLSAHITTVTPIYIRMIGTSSYTLHTSIIQFIKQSEAAINARARVDVKMPRVHVIYDISHC